MRASAANATIAKGDVFKFGSNPVNSRLVFFQNMYVFAFLVPNPICHLKGHTIITPKRNVSNVSDLNVSELFDLSLQTQFISGLLKKFYSASSLTIHMRDGQSQYDNCCVHLLPRKGEDIAYNDDIYKELQNYVNSVYSQMNPRDFNNLDDQCMKLSGMVMDKERKAQEDSWIK